MPTTAAAAHTTTRAAHAAQIEKKEVQKMNPWLLTIPASIAALYLVIKYYIFIEISMKEE